LKQHKTLAFSRNTILEQLYQ